MNKYKLFFSTICLTSILACQTNKPNEYAWIKNALDVSSTQLQIMGNRLKDCGMYPRSIHQHCDTMFISKQLERDVSVFIDSLESTSTPEQYGKILLCPPTDWTSGFFPGSLWYAYELTDKKSLKNLAIHYTNGLDTVRYIKNTHDIGFIINCSYGNGYRITHEDTIKNIIIESANNLCTRFNDTIGCIRSWDFGEWNYPVIIDNMMNLELLFNAYNITSNVNYKNVAYKHAMTTLKNHFRNDYTCYHIVSYNNDGSIEYKRTHQGKHDESAWARGQAWAVYGYTVCYRETKDSTFLNQAVNVADMIMKRVKTNDIIPLWDYDAINDKDTPRDASAAAVTASAFIDLSILSNNNKYFEYAEKILKSLSSDKYLAKVGENQNFILMHSTGSIPNGFEIDAPLNYADYYFLEGLQKYMKVKNIQYSDL